MSNRKMIATFSLFLASALASGCASTANTDATRVEDDFGHSVRQMVKGQIYDPKAASKPPAEPPMGMDGVQGEAVLKTHREHVGDPNSVSDDLRIGVDQ